MFSRSNVSTIYIQEFRPKKKMLRLAEKLPVSSFCLKSSVIFKAETKYLRFVEISGTLTTFFMKFIP